MFSQKIKYDIKKNKKGEWVAKRDIAKGDLINVPMEYFSDRSRLITKRSCCHCGAYAAMDKSGSLCIECSNL